MKNTRMIHRAMAAGCETAADLKKDLKGVRK